MTVACAQQTRHFQPFSPARKSAVAAGGIGVRRLGGRDMKKFLLAGAATALLAGAAMAADLPVRPGYPPPVLPLYNWTGCYLGGNVGGLWVRKEYTASTGIGAPIGTGLGNHDANSFLAGIQGGCNYQAPGGWVFGVQADYDWANAKGQH